ncbi:tyrosine-type recombinase/integrase [Planococcus maritimus]|uniref:Tyrosine-type recombinase/integrase n=1 Tax=Planococcus maritimus TaxID=192421 RepID=A0A7D7M8P5_PLAMR|nr:tyrosine-type recombinase/integrase [Planococcus maritimus]QMT16237.1 tyrosine-type recombinase/integrase [Planococcus maritimus]
MAYAGGTKGDIINVQPLRTIKEITDMIEALSMSPYTACRNVLLFKIGISTGLRIGDIVKLRISDVKGKSNFKIREGKTKKERTVHLNAIMADIADYTEGLESSQDYLFASRKGENHITTTQAYRVLTNAAALLGRYDVGTHTMRKTFGYHYYKRTRDILTLMNIFNHSDQSTTKRYIGITEEEVADTLKNFRLF